MAKEATLCSRSRYFTSRTLPFCTDKLSFKLPPHWIAWLDLDIYVDFAVGLSSLQNFMDDNSNFLAIKIMLKACSPRF